MWGMGLVRETGPHFLFSALPAALGWGCQAILSPFQEQRPSDQAAFQASVSPSTKRVTLPSVAGARITLGTLQP